MCPTSRTDPKITVSPLRKTMFFLSLIIAVMTVSHLVSAAIMASSLIPDQQMGGKTVIGTHLFRKQGEIIRGQQECTSLAKRSGYGEQHRKTHQYLSGKNIRSLFEASTYLSPDNGLELSGVVLIPQIRMELAEDSHSPKLCGMIGDEGGRRDTEFRVFLIDIAKKQPRSKQICINTSAIQTSGSGRNEMAEKPPSVGDTVMNRKSPTMAEQPVESVEFREIRKVVQTIDGIVHSWREYKFLTSENRCFIAVETVLPNKKFLSVREAKALLRASGRISGGTPKPDEMTVVPPSNIEDIPAIEEPFSLEPFLDQTTPKNLPKDSPVNVPDEDTEDRSKENSTPKKD
jgi:hypothetical protein